MADRDRLTPLPSSPGWDVWPAGYEIPRLPYRVIRALGKGGMGIVYEVEDVRDGSRRAVKAILRHLTGDRDAIKRLRFELQTARSLPMHPGLPAVGSFFKTPDGVVGFDMELLEGFSLRDTLRRSFQQLQPARAAELAIDVLSALEVVHRAGYVHRDVKPNNIFLTTGGRVVLLDFGVTKALFDAPGRPSTAKGHLPGTPNYMAPEYLSETNTLSAKFDIYAAGLVLWECITGRAAFAQKNVLQTTHAIVTAGVPSLVKMGFDWLPRDFLLILERATAKDPDDRYETAEECARDLSAVLPLLLSFPPPTRASIPSVIERTASLGPKAVVGFATPAPLDPQGAPAASEWAAPDEEEDPLSLGDDEANATEIRMPTMTVVLHVGHDGAQGSPLVLVRSQANGADYPTELVSLDDVTTAKRADLAAYLSTIDPYGGTEPDPLAVDFLDEGSPALAMGGAPTLRSLDGSGAPDEAPHDGQTTRDAPRWYPEGHRADSGNEGERSSSPEGLARSAHAEQAVDAGSRAHELGPPSGPTNRAEAGSPAPTSGSLAAPTNDVREAPERVLRTVEPDEGGEEDEANLWGPTWPLYAAPPSHLFMPPRRRPRPSEGTDAEQRVSTPLDSARPTPEVRHENDDNIATALRADDGPPIPESVSEEERLRELLPDMETNLRNPLAVVASGPEPEPTAAEETRPLGSTGRGAGATILAMAKALAEMLKPLGLSLASRAVRWFGLSLALAAGRRASRATAGALPAPKQPQQPAATDATNPPTKERK